MFFILLLLFISLPLIEIFLLLEVGGEIGAMNTFAIVIVTGVVGAWLARREGRSVLKDLSQTMQEGREPTDLILQGVLVFAGGLLLLTPGFVTDILGLSLVAPGTRSLFIRGFKTYLKKAMATGRVKVYSQSSVFGQRPQDPFSNGSSGSHQNRHSSDVIDVEAERLDKKP